MASQNRQRERIRKEQEKIRATKAAENQANEERLENPTPPVNTTTKDKLPDPSQIPAVDPEILPEAEQTIDKVTTLEGDVAEVSLDYTLTDEGEGDNISGNKELRDEAEYEDENNFKRPKVPLNPAPTK